MNFLSKYVLHSPKHYIAAVGVNVFFTLIVLFVRGFDKLIYYIDGISVAGGISFFYGLLLWVASLGAFRIFGYSFSSFRGTGRYRDFYEYTQAVTEKQAKQKKIHMPYILVGLVFLIISFILSSFLF